MMEHQQLKTIDYDGVIQGLKNDMQELKEQIKMAPKTPIALNKTVKPMVTIKQVENILNHADKEKKALLQSGWTHFKDYPKPHLKNGCLSLISRGFRSCLRYHVTCL